MCLLVSFSNTCSPILQLLIYMYNAICRKMSNIHFGCMFIKASNEFIDSQEVKAVVLAY